MRGVADESDMQLAEQSGLGRKVVDKNFVRFYKKPILNKEKTKTEGRPIYEPAEYVEIHIPAEPQNVVNSPVQEKHKARYPQQYEAFLKDQDQDAASGTLLSAWGMLTPERIEELKYFKIVTVDQLSSVSDVNMGKLGPKARQEREAAKNFLDAAKGNAPVMKLQAQLEEKDARLQALEEQLKELAAQVQAQQKPQQGGHQNQNKKG
jgi:hypothetical protein